MCVLVYVGVKILLFCASTHEHMNIHTYSLALAIFESLFQIQIFDLCVPESAQHVHSPIPEKECVHVNLR